jgi:NitT/TauT family transport system substrate-binding protein
MHGTLQDAWRAGGRVNGCCCFFFMGNEMSTNERKSKSILNRRSLLQGGAAATFAAPLGVLGAKAFPARIPGAIDFSEFPICKTSSDAPALTGPPRKLKFSWNAGAVCLAPLPVAIDYGFFQK